MAFSSRSMCVRVSWCVLRSHNARILQLFFSGCMHKTVLWHPRSIFHTHQVVTTNISNYRESIQVTVGACFVSDGEALQNTPR